MLTVQGPSVRRVQGLVRAADVVDGTFTLVNASAETLSVAELRMSCGCTEAQLAPEIIEPGAEARLDVMLDTLGKSGELQAKVDLLGADGAVLASVSLSCVVEEVPSVYASPASVGLPSAEGAAAGQIATVQLILERQQGYADGPPVWIPEPSGSGPLRVAEVQGPDLVEAAGRETWTWSFLLGADGTGRLDEVLTLTVDDGRQPRETRVAVHRPEDAWIVTESSSFFLGRLAAETSWSGATAVRRLDCDPELVRIETSAAWLSAGLEGRRVGVDLALRLSGTPPASVAGAIDESVWLRRDGLEEVHIPVRGVVR